jgi:hypothetical protein
MTQRESSAHHRSSTVRTTRIRPCPRLAVAIVSLTGLGVLVMRNLGIVVFCAALGGCVSTNETIAFRTSNP